MISTIVGCVRPGTSRFSLGVLKGTSMERPASTKRKRSSIKFYSVRSGHKPGVYQTWDDCLKQVKGFKGAIYKSFASLTDAEKFLGGENPDIQRKHGSRNKTKYYAVKSGKVPGIYTDWESAQKQISGWPKPRHKCFSTRVEAQRFLDERPSEVNVHGTGVDKIANDDNKHPAKRLRTNDDSERLVALSNSTEQGSAAQPHAITSSFSISEDGFDPTIILDPLSGEATTKSGFQMRATKLRASRFKQDGVIYVYTDGSALNNGQQTAVAGVGVYFGPGDPKNISEPLSGPRQTNQRAELTAILRALEALPRDRDVEIITDSQYSIKCVTEWCHTWRQNGWKTAAGKSVDNRDLVEAILEITDQRAKTGTSTTCRWTKGHAESIGNIQADKLAVEGAHAAAKLAADRIWSGL